MTPQYTSPVRRWNEDPDPMVHLDGSAFDKGVKAFKKNNWNNPYEEGTDQNKEWQRGWNYSYHKAARRARSVERSIMERANV